MMLAREMTFAYQLGAQESRSGASAPGDGEVTVSAV